MRDEKVLVPHDATLALYTDGLVEHRNAGIDDGIDRLAEAFLDSAAAPRESIDSIVKSLAPNAEDDLALLLVEFGDVPDDLESRSRQTCTPSESSGGVSTAGSPNARSTTTRSTPPCSR